jgi:hypothetical protein
MKDHSSHHQSSSNLIRPSTSAEVVISYLLSLKSQAKDLRATVLDSLIKIHEALQKKSLKWLKELDTFSSEIDSLVENLKTHNFNLSEGILAKTLKMSVDQALKETNKWMLIKNELNVENLIKSISDSKGISFNLSLLYEDEKVTTRVYSEESMNKSSSNLLSSNQPQPFARKSVPARPGTSREIPMPLIPHCEMNHELTFNNTTHFNYWDQKKCYMITCNLCNKKVTEATWNCLQCNYDICRSCARTRNYKTPVLECNQKHELTWRCDYIGLQSNNFKCSSCKEQISQQARWNCKSCDFNKCLTCGIRAGFKPLLSKPQCLKYHDLTIVEIIFQEKNVKYCKLCNHPVVGKSLNCSQCLNLFCLDCSPRLREATAGHPIVACYKGHVALWRSLNSPCAYCDQVSNFGFFCILCNFKICLNCCNFLIEVISKPISKALNGKALTWQPKCNEFPLNKKQVFCVMCREDIKMNGYFKSDEVNSQVCLLCFRDPDRSKRINIPNSSNDIMNLLILNQLLNSSINFNS